MDPSIRKSDLNDLSSFYLSGHSSWLFSYIHALYSVTLQFLLLQSGVSFDLLNLGWLSNSMWQKWPLAGFQPCLFASLFFLGSLLLYVNKPRLMCSSMRDHVEERCGPQFTASQPQSTRKILASIHIAADATNTDDRWEQVSQHRLTL